MGTVPKNTKMCKWGRFQKTQKCVNVAGQRPATDPSPKTQKRVNQNRPQKHKNVSNRTVPKNTLKHIGSERDCHETDLLKIL